MTPDERAQLDAYAIRFGMDSIDVDEALARVGGDSATLRMARAADMPFSEFVRRAALAAARRRVPTPPQERADGQANN